MIGEPENSVCPLCGGHLQADVATIPFILDRDTVVVIKGVPAEVCKTFMRGFESRRRLQKSQLLRKILEENRNSPKTGPKND